MGGGKDEEGGEDEEGKKQQSNDLPVDTKNRYFRPGSSPRRLSVRQDVCALSPTLGGDLFSPKTSHIPRVREE